MAKQSTLKEYEEFKEKRKKKKQDREELRSQPEKAHSESRSRTEKNTGGQSSSLDDYERFKAERRRQKLQENSLGETQGNTGRGTSGSSLGPAVSAIGNAAKESLRNLALQVEERQKSLREIDWDAIQQRLTSQSEKAEKRLLRSRVNEDRYAWQMDNVSLSEDPWKRTERYEQLQDQVRSNGQARELAEQRRAIVDQQLEELPYLKNNIQYMGSARSLERRLEELNQELERTEQWEPDMGPTIDSIENADDAFRAVQEGFADVNHFLAETKDRAAEHRFREKERDYLQGMYYAMLPSQRGFEKDSQLAEGEESNYTRAMMGQGKLSDMEKEMLEDTAGDLKVGDEFTVSDYLAMTEDEVNIYHYLLHTKGEKDAEDYMFYILPNLRYRRGEARAEEARSIPILGGVVLAAESGLDSFDRGLTGLAKGLFGLDNRTDYIPSGTQYGSSIYREDLGTLPGVLYDLAQTTANMAPSVGVGLVSPLAGSTLLGTSAGGNAYLEARAEGKDRGESLLYGALSGGSELVMGQILGAATNMGGGILRKAAGRLGSTAAGQQAASLFNRALSRVSKSSTFQAAAKHVLAEMGSEGAEEYFQDLVNPLFRNLAFGENNEFALFTEDAAYSFLLGALSGGMFAAGDSAIRRLRGQHIDGGTGTPTLESITRDSQYFQGVADEAALEQRFADLAAENQQEGDTYHAIAEEYGRIVSDWSAVKRDVVPASEGPVETEETVLSESGQEASEGTVLPVSRRLAEEVAAERTIQEAAPDTAALVQADRPALAETAAQTTPEASLSRQEGFPGREESAQTTDALPARTASRIAEANPVENASQIQNRRRSVAERILQAPAVVADSGRPVTVTEFSAMDVEPQVSLSDGTVVPLADVTFEDADVEQLYQAAVRLGDAGAANVMLAGYRDESLSPAFYASTFQDFFDAGKAGRNFEQMYENSAYSALFDRRTAYYAWALGEHVQNKGKESRVGAEQRAAVSALGEALGVPVEFIPEIRSESGAEANGMLKDGKVYISENTEDPAAVVLAHELTHQMQEAAPEAYQAYRDFVLDYFRRERPQDYGQILANLQELYGTRDVDLLADELVANATEAFLTDTRAVEQVARENPSLARRILDSIRGVIEKLKGLLSDYEPKSLEARALRQNLEVYEEAEKLWVKGLAEMSRRMMQTDSHSKARHSIRLTDADIPEYLDAGGRMNKNKLEAYNSGKQIILRSDGEIKSYIDHVLDNGSEGVPTVAYGRVSDRLAAAVRENSQGEIVVDGLYLEFVPADIIHAYNGHSTVKQTGNIPLSRKVFEEIPELLDSFSEVVYARQFKSGNTRLVVSTKTEGGIVVIVETVSRSRGALQFKNIIGMTEQAYESYYAEELKKSRANSGGDPEGLRHSLRDAPASVTNIADSSQDGKGKFSLKKNMSEKERAAELRQMTLAPAVYHPERLPENGRELEQLVNTYKSRAKQLIKPLAEKFGVFKSYRNEQVELEFQYSKSSLEESLYKQNERTREFDSFAKMLSCFDEVVKNAQPVYIHDDKYRGTRREDPQIKQVYVLVSAYWDTDSSAVPVELLIKEYQNIQNKLYVSVTMHKIKGTDLKAQTSFSHGEDGNNAKSVPDGTSLYGETSLSQEESVNTSKLVPNGTSLYGQAERSGRANSKYPKLVPNITLPELFAKINPLDRDFLKYVPDEFLNAAQRAAKGQALAEEADKIDSLRYSLKDTAPTDPASLPELDSETLSILEEGLRVLGDAPVKSNVTQGIARRLVKEYSSSYPAETLASNLDKLFAYVKSHEGQVDARDMERIMLEVARPVVEQTRSLDRSTEGDYNALREYLKGKKIRLNDQQKAAVAYAYGSYNEYRKKNFGKVALSKNGISLDSIWSELCDQFPAYFKADTNPDEQIFELVDTLEALKPSWKNAEGLDVTEASRDLALRIYQEYFMYQNNAQLEALRKELNAKRVQKKREAKASGETRVERAKAKDPALQGLKNKRGFLPKGERPARDVDVPQYDSKGGKVRRFTRTVLESASITDEMVQPIQDQILEGGMSYQPQSNELSMKRAKDVLERYGLERARDRWRAMVNGNRLPKAEDVALGEALLREYARKGDAAAVVQLTAELAAVGTRAGQVVQALRMMKRMEELGELKYIGDLYFVEKSVESINRQLERRFKGKEKIPYIKVDPELAEQYAGATDPKEQERIAGEIYRDLGRQLPSTWLDKWNAWRYLSMLGNPRTHIRNIIGNAIFMPAVKLKNLQGAALEAIFLRKRERSKALRVSREYRRFARENFQQVKEILASGGKYNEQSRIEENRVVFQSRIKILRPVMKALQFASSKNSWLLEAEDMLFLSRHYQTALGQYLQANKADLENMSQEFLDRAMAYAVREAQKATYRDASALASVLSRASRSNKALNLALEGILPFKKTPINILKRGVEYSPAGLIGTLVRGTRRLRKGQITANEYLDSLAAGLTGTEVMAVGAFLASCGFLKGALGDDPEDELAELTGEQGYAVQVGDVSFTVDWAAPLSLPLFVGAELQAVLAGEYGGAQLADYAETLMQITEPMFNLSMLSGLSDTIEAVSFSENKLTALGIETVSSYLQQAFPTLGGQISRTMDPVARRNYTDQNSPIPSDAQYFLQRVMGKIPALSFLKEPMLNAWGEEDVEDNVLLRAFENFLSPGYISRVEESAVERELAEIFQETGDGGVVPRTVEKRLQVAGERVDLTAEEYTRLQKRVGQDSYRILEDLIGLDVYDDMEMTTRAAIVEGVYEYAVQLAQRDLFGREADSWVDSVEELENQGIPAAMSILVRQDIAQQELKGEEVREYIGRLRVSQDEEAALLNLVQESDYAALRVALSRDSEVQENIDQLYQEQLDQGKEPSQAAGAVRGEVTAEYQDAWIEGDSKTRAAIEEQLLEYEIAGEPMYERKDFLGWQEGGQYAGLYEAMDSGDGIRESVRELTSYGVSERSIASQLTRQYKPTYIQLYRSNRSQAAQLKSRLLSAYQAAGYDREEKSKDIDAWLED